MNTRLVLGSLLAAQVVLALGLMWQGQARSVDNQAEPWLDFPSAEINKIVVSDSSSNTTLELKDGQWRLTDPALPANSAKINSLLTSLEGLKTTWPVVSTAAGRERFEVTEDNHQRELSLFRDDTLLGEYYFGTSPGFRQTHARRANDDEVYALAFNNFDLPADSNDWLDKELLAAKDPTMIKGTDFTLIKKENGWEFDVSNGTGVSSPQAPAEETATPSELERGGESAVTSALDTADTLSGNPAINADAASKLASALTNLRVLRVAADAPAGDPVTVEVQSGTATLTYLFTRMDTTYYVRRSDIEHTFTLAESDYKAIAEQNLAGLTASTPAPGAPAPVTADAAPEASEPELPRAPTATPEVH